MSERKRHNVAAWAVHAVFALSACSSSSSPSAQNVTWNLSAEKGGYVFTLKADLNNGDDGGFFPRLETVDERGCHHVEDVGWISTMQANNRARIKANIEHHYKYGWKVARAGFSLNYTEIDTESQQLFSEDRLVDPRLTPPEMPKQPCSDRPTNAKLRERAKTDPDGADAEAIGGMSRNEVVATAINSAGFLCAKVTDLYPSGSDMIVSCTEYRNGRGKVRYRVNASAGTVDQM